jgi:hypothetical protein
MYSNYKRLVRRLQWLRAHFRYSWELAQYYETKRNIDRSFTALIRQVEEEVGSPSYASEIKEHYYKAWDAELAAVVKPTMPKSADFGF